MAARDLFDELIDSAILEQWIAEQREEGLHLEFKSRDRAPTAPPAKHDVLDNEDKTVIAKAMSAFANVDGGVLVLGLRTQRAGDTNKLAPDQPLLEKPNALAEKVLAIVKDATSPMIAGVDVRAVTRHDGRGVVAVFVPPSDGGPHRVTIGGEKVRDRYFIRSGDSSNVAEHQILAAMFGRTPPPRLRLFASWRRESSVVTLNLYLRNDGRGTAISPAVTLRTQQPARIRGSYGAQPHATSDGNLIMCRPANARERLYSGMEESVGTFTLGLAPHEGYQISATLYADGCAPTHVAATLNFPGEMLVEVEPLGVRLATGLGEDANPVE